MTTEELVLQINRNHRVRAEKIDGRIFVYNDTSHLLFTFDEKATNFLDFTFNDQLPSDSMGKASREYLSALIEEFLYTPIKERFPERKYYLCVFSKKEALERRGEYEAIWVNHIGNYHDGFHIDYGPKTAFTEETLNTIKESLPFITSAIDAMKIPVEDD